MLALEEKDEIKLDIERQIDKRVIPLRQGHLWRASGVWVKAFEEDPQMQYIRDTDKQTFWEKVADRISMASLLTFTLPFDRVGFTVESGTAYVVATIPGTSKEDPKGIRRIAAKIVKGCAAVIYRKMGTEEQRKRSREMEGKYRKEIERIFGDQIKNMICVEILVTDPDKQGQGYGSALLDTVTSLADDSGKLCWLVSSNIKNTRFYHLHGFITVRNVRFGDQNPKWHHEPVTGKIMVRWPRRGRKN